MTKNKNCRFIYGKEKCLFLIQPSFKRYKSINLSIKQSNGLHKMLLFNMIYTEVPILMYLYIIQKSKQFYLKITLKLIFR